MRAYGAHGDRNVKVLAAVVLLEGVDVKPDLRTDMQGEASPPELKNHHNLLQSESVTSCFPGR